MMNGNLNNKVGDGYKSASMKRDPIKEKIKHYQKNPEDAVELAVKYLMIGGAVFLGAVFLVCFWQFVLWATIVLVGCTAIGFLLHMLTKKLHEKYLK